MRRVTLSALAALALVACGQSTDDGADDTAAQSVDPLAAHEPSPEQRAEVIAAVQSLFDALETGDEALLRSVIHPSVVMHSSETRDGSTTFGSANLDGLASRITTSEVPLIERMWDQIVVVNGPLATLWTPYDFYVGPTFSHCGVDAANLMHTEDGWRIVALSWTRLQPPACDLNPLGPPGA